MVAFFLHARTLGECSTINFVPACFFNVDIGSCKFQYFCRDQSTVGQ